MADYQTRLTELETADISVYALSTDDYEHAAKVVEEDGLTFPVLYGVNGAELSAAWGSYYDEQRGILQATGFVLGPDGKVRSATYSTGPIGRMLAQDALRFIRFVKSRENRQ